MIRFCFLMSIRFNERYRLLKLLLRFKLLRAVTMLIWYWTFYIVLRKLTATRINLIIIFPFLFMLLTLLVTVISWRFAHRILFLFHCFKYFFILIFLILLSCWSCLNSFLFNWLLFWIGNLRWIILRLRRGLPWM